ncbi:ABC transporter substrate-binding protein [Candidatus Gracilibacteria bacterium]|nr:ABC transporter substrate-binding protein [Candidatus Gracilibacteria bacterium]
MKKLLLGFGFISLLVGCQNEIAKNNSSDTIYWGAIAPLTGDMAPYGLMDQNVARMWLEKTNLSGGVLGKPLKIIWEDGKCTPGDAAQAAQKLINVDKVKIILGTTCSGGTLSTAPIYEKNKILTLNPFATNPTIKDAGDFIFRNVPSDSIQGKIMGEYASGKYKKVGIIVEQTDYALGVCNTFAENFSGEIVKEEYLASESDFKTRITKLKGSDIEALIVCNQFPNKGDILLKQLEEQNWTLPLLHNEVITGTAEVYTKHADFLKKVQAIGANFIAPNTPEVRNFAEEYKDKYGAEPPYLNYAAAAQDALNILKNIVEQVGTDQDTEKLKNALYDGVFQGLYGTITFDEFGESTLTHQLFSFDGEKYIPFTQ